MALNNFNGTLRINEIIGSIYNMIISQEVFADNISGSIYSLVDRFKVDGSLYGDTKLYYSTDALESAPWTNYAEASNLLETKKPPLPFCQAITLDKFRQIFVTLDNYLSKRAFSTEGAFSSFHGVVLSWVRETKRIYEVTLINTYIGTVEAPDQTISNVEIAINAATTGATGEEKNRLEALTIAEGIANLFVNLSDLSRDFNSYKVLRAYSPSDLLVVWNSKYVNKIRKVDLPTIFHKDGLIDKFEEEVLPERYFGDVIAALDGTTYTGTVQSSQVGTIRVLDEGDYTKAQGADPIHLFAGDALPVNYTYKAGEAYAVDGDLICKIVHKNGIKFMSAFEVGTTFFNPRSLTENHYLTWGFSSPEYLRNYPVISVHAD